MKEIVNKYKERFIRFLSNIQKREIPNISDSSFFHSLSPTDDADNVDNYIQSIDWALKNKTKIKNIAISGAYGSGKSSVIKTFIKRNTNKRYKFLNISLATFKELKEQPSGTTKDDVDILRLIELSVLQQLFYHETDGKIPDSRFKKIKSHKKRFLICYSIGLIIFLISLLYLLTPDLLAKFYLIKISKSYAPIAHYSATIITLMGLLFVIFKSSRAIKNVAIKKLNISNAVIEIDSGISKSILNNHIDEILYFFEVTDYNVVVIEDLDRFEQTEVFTKLREINLLINNSKKIEDEVVFIYAIKDDMFLDKDRTKFFDFMIPIIPVINSSNSNEKLLEIVKKNEYNVSMDLIDDISLFIDDMRLLYNIMNEYYIYSKNQDSTLDQEKLLSIIVYKNIYPNDFTLLNENKGDLFQTISNKSIYLKNKILVVDQKIDEIKKQIVETEKLRLSDIKELRIIYINKIIEQIINTEERPFKHFLINDVAYDLTSLTEEKNFSNLFSGSIQYHYDNSVYNIRSYSFKFEAIEKLVNPDLSYKEREELLLNKAKIDSFKKQISELENSKVEIRKSRLCDLISDSQITVNQKSEKQSELINILLRNGYIDENYLDYISIFYEGSLSKADYQFLINVKIQKPSEYDHKLTKKEKLIEKINLYDFDKEYILNFDIVEFLLKKPKSNEKRKRLFKQLSNESESSLDFIDRFLEITTDEKTFIQNLCEHWHNIWDYIENESLFEDEKKNKYFSLIIKYAKVDNIKSIFSFPYRILNQKSDFLQIIDDEDKLKMIIKELDLKFEKINPDSPKSLIDFVYVGSYYDLNMEVIEMLLKHYKKFDFDRFSKANFAFIMSCSLEHLIKYIERNIQDYINNVYLNIETNTEEPLDFYLRLLNNEKLVENLKEKIIIQVNTIITDITDVSDNNLWDILFEYNKVSPLWNNIHACFENEENSFSKDLITYLNNISNAEQLSKIKMPIKVNDKVIYTGLVHGIIYEEEINDKSYNLITKSFPWWYSDLEFGKISENRIITLINNMVINPTIKSFNLLKETHNGLNIRILEKFPNKYIEKTEELELDSYDLELILESTTLTNTNKKVFYENCDTEKVNSNDKALLLLTDFLVKKVDIKVEVSTKKKILLSTFIPKDKRITIFNQANLSFDRNFIDSFIKSLGDEYKDVSDYDRKALLPYNPLNRIFLEKLKAINYLSSFTETNKGLRVNHKRK